MVSKLPRGTLERLPEGSRTALEQVILSGQKDNFRVLVGEILSGNAEKSIEEIEEIMDLLDDEFREYFVNQIVDSIKNDSYQHMELFFSLIKIGRIGKEIIDEVFDKNIMFLKRASISSNCEELIINLISSGEVDNSKIDDLLNFISKSNSFFIYSNINIIINLIKNNYFNEKLIEAINNFFEKELDDNNNVKTFDYIIKKFIEIGKIGEKSIKYLNEFYRKLLDELKIFFYDSKRKELRRMGFSNIKEEHLLSMLVTLLETGRINDELVAESKIILNLFFDEFGKVIVRYDRLKLIPTLLKNLPLPRKFINNLLDRIIKYGLVGFDGELGGEIIPILLKKGKVSKKRLGKIKSLLFKGVEELFVDFGSNRFDEIGEKIFPKLVECLDFNENEINRFYEIISDGGYINVKTYEFMLPSLIKTGKLSQKNINKLFDYAIGNIDHGQIFHTINSIIESGKIDNERIYRLKNIIFEKIKRGNSDYVFGYILPILIGKIELTKEQERLLNEYFFRKKNYGLIESGKFKLFEKKDEEQIRKTKEKYPLNYSLFKQIYEKIVSYDDDFKIFNYLKTIFLQIEKLEALNKLLNYEINKKFFIQNFEKVLKISETKSLEFGYFKLCVINGEKIPENFPIHKGNFTDFLDNDESFLEFEKDKGIDFEIRPWTKKWFLENPERENYLNKDKIKTFEKFGTIIALGLIEGSQNVESVKKFYEHIFSQIKYSTNRTSILQLGEVFNLILKQESYEIFNELIPGVGDYFRSFIEDYNISDKGRTILTLMIVREIRDSFQIFGEEGKQQVDYVKLEEMIKRVYEKLKMYRPIIDKYKDLPIQTSIGMEYEVTESIAKGYKEEIGSDYKNDIVILSEYSGVANGRDAVHEIATRPTNNPYLLILEMKLLDDLDFVDLNFKRGDYARGSRGLHITLGGEEGIKVDTDTNFIQNILIAGNLGGVNVGEEVKIVNRQVNIREKGSDCEALFGEEKTECTEFRALSIDKKEQFERLVISIFNLNMVYQLFKKYLDGFAIDPRCLSSVDDFTNYIKNNLNGTCEINELDEKRKSLIYEYIKLIEDILDMIENHSPNFEIIESLNIGDNKSLQDLLMILTSTSPLVQIFQKSGVDIYYLRGLCEDEINSGLSIENQKDFEDILKKDGKKVDELTPRQREILYLGYKVQIRKLLSKLKQENKEIYDNIGEYLNGNTDETIRKITNRKRFEEVIASTGMTYEEYMKSLVFPGSREDIFEEISPELVNIFTRINNLFIKKDSINALSMYDNTREENGEIVSDRRLTETTIFDKVEMGLNERFGHYIIQGASENMLTQAIQARILEFNKRVL